MIIVLSPAKSLDFDTPPRTKVATTPDFLDEAAKLIVELRKQSPAQLAGLMSISDALAHLNVGRYAQWTADTSSTEQPSKQAALAFNGDVYGGLDAPSLSVADLKFAQKHLRILSGLYGVLRPLDLIQPYRLEMGTRLTNARGKDLYAFWGERIAQTLQQAAGQAPIVNLASEEYFRSVKRDALSSPVITPVFEDYKGGRYKIISFYAKRARGLMARYAITERLKDAKGLKHFDLDGYAFAADATGSSEHTWVFRRRVAGA
ncbi:MAG: peroxide stress protein YaaA [Janthinobacterium lividum]